MNRRTLLAAMLAAPAVARAQSWAPSRPIRFVVPFPAGGGTDVAARILGERLQEALGQPVVVENRTGSGGNLGMENAARSPADGHTLVMGTTGTLTINPHLYANLGFDPARDLAPISMAFTTDHVLIVNPGVQAQTAQEFLALARAQPGRLTYGSAGSGSSTHMVAELFRLAADIQVLHVPYRGSAPALNDTVAGTVQFMLDQLPSAIGQIQGGRVRALAVTGPRRAALLPDVPTVAEIGLPAAESTSWGAVLAPAGTPAPAIARINAVLREAAAQPAVRERMAAAGADAAASTPEELIARMGRENERWARVVRDARITIN
ncbi:Bug family tripartite tricarboxylate transporter substrate binding protein [Plastoroseomonas hellenica]|uniref:Bug family tripartite tricarboxylate transporter substrate binding protein n=1 Tax=Plastoroseomonas hellenica TaxID=2687306 RepID=UPI001BA73DE8|nr:tripartite tricarboxylate transporter substrate binding protein [Plastoroseomonas hellenica]MBR0643171.1 tripartite tricarboxylate transporter substrate binding protein [Plastoroseomonas hellenica]